MKTEQGIAVILRGGAVVNVTIHDDVVAHVDDRDERAVVKASDGTFLHIAPRVVHDIIRAYDRHRYRVRTSMLVVDAGRGGR